MCSVELMSQVSQDNLTWDTVESNVTAVFPLVDHTDWFFLIQHVPHISGCACFVCHADDQSVGKYRVESTPVSESNKEGS